MDIFGIYAFLIGSAIGFPELISLNILLGIITATLYLSNKFIKPEYYCGVRPFGVLGLLFKNLQIFMLISATLGTGMVIFKGVRVIKRVKG